VDAQNVDMVKTALNNDALPTPCVATAAYLNNDAIVKLLVDKGGDANNAMRPMVDANKIDMVSYLLQRGATASGDGYYITRASQMKWLPMAELLCENGADPNLAMPLAVQFMQEDMVLSMLNFGASPKGYMEDPARLNQIGIAKTLLDYGADPNEGMFTAVAFNQTDATRLFLQYGASPHGVMTHAAKQNNMEIVNMLLDAGADASEGLPGAIAGNHTNITDLLLQRGAKVQEGMLGEPGRNAG